MTYNIRGGLGMDGRRETARIAEAVLREKPEIVCLQEVHQRLPWSGWIDQPRRLSELLGMQVCFQRNLNTLIGGYGLAIASSFPMTDVKRRFLPSHGERRGALCAVIDTPLGAVQVWCTHWGLREEERMRQAEQLAKWVGEERSPQIVCGDCNERIGDAAVQRFLQRTGLRDLAEEPADGTYPADQPTARIDFLLASPQLRLMHCWVANSHASDHRPVVCDLERSALTPIAQTHSFPPC